MVDKPTDDGGADVLNRPGDAHIPVPDVGLPC